MHQRTVLLCLLGFSVFLRVSELIAIQVKHLVFTTGRLEITIPKSKSDQHREGHIVYIKRANPTYCLVCTLESYLSKTNLIHDPENFVISRLAKTKLGHNAHGKKTLADTTIRDIFNRDVAPICNKLETGQYSLHSLRSGGASSASNNGVTERMIGKHGRWKSGFCRDRYIKDSKKRRLDVSASLGL